MGLGTGIVLLLCGVALSAFFSGTETALTALPFSRVVALARGSRPALRWAWRRWRVRPHRVLVTLLAGNTLVNIGVSAVATSAAVRLLGDRGLGVAIGVTTFAVLTFGEVTPKTLARANPETLCRAAILPVAALDWLATPLTVPLVGFSQLVARLTRVSLQATPVATRTEDVRFLLKLAREQGHVSELQHGMLEAVLRLEGTQVREVQVPRTDVVFLRDTASREEVRRRVAELGYSRYPVYHERDDNVVGILLAKDLLRSASETGPWTNLLQPPLFVPESKQVVELLREMREARTHIAVSVDEYGNIAGIVALEDLLELVVGDIEDEFDTGGPAWRAEGKGRWLVRGVFPLERLSRLTGTPLESMEYNSVAGLVLELAGKVPPVGAHFQLGGLRLEVVRASARRIEQVRVSLSPSG
ncbi:MAG: hemolysin family protein [Thermoanaerobaculales bacterium]|jgi:putative hemolysin